MHIENDIRELIYNALNKISNEKLSEVSLSIVLEIPADNKNGDYSSPVALEGFKVLKNSGLMPEEVKSPRMLADMICGQINSTKPEFVSNIETAGPGFINFYLNKNVLAGFILKKALDRDFYNYNDNKRTKIIVEHTSVNPNKAMHIGHLRNAFIGDMIAGLLKKFNYDVEIHNYIDDTGVQVADTTLAVIQYGDQSSVDQAFDDYAWDIYAEINKQYKIDKTLEGKREAISKELESCHGEIFDKSQEVVSKIVKSHLDLLGQLVINYDLLVYESDILRSKFWDSAFEKLKDTNAFYLETEGDQKGCWVLRYKDEKVGNKIFVRSNGTVVYTAKDLAYHMWKFGILGRDFGYVIEKNSANETYRTAPNGDNAPSSLGHNFGRAERIITVVDNRQEYPQEMVRYALEALGYQKEYQNYKHLSYGVVNLSADTAKELGLNVADEKTSYAMSGRKGIGIKAKDILSLLGEKIKEANPESNHKAIAAAALKHYMLKFNPSTEIVFDYKDALNLKGNTGPYLQYSLARANSILSKVNKTIDVPVVPHAFDQNTEDLIKLMGEWNSVLEKASKDLVLSYIADYAFKLSAAFHRFYETNNVLKSEESLLVFRLAVVKSYINTVVDVLDVMGIEPLESM